MLVVYYCPECYRTAYLAKNRANCNKCQLLLQRLDVSYVNFIKLNEEERLKAIQKHLLEKKARAGRHKKKSADQ